MTHCNSDGDSPLYIAVYGIARRLKVSCSAEQRSRQVQLGVLLIDSLISAGNNFNCVYKQTFYNVVFRLKVVM